MRAGAKPPGEDAAAAELLNAAPDAMLVSDTEGIIQLVNREAERLLGYGRQELIGSNIDLLVPDGVRSAHGAHRAGYSADPRARPMGAERELHARRKDGTEFAAAITLSPVPTASGLLIMAAVRDITHLRLERSRLEAAEELFRTTIDHAPIGIALVAPDGRWLRVNRALCEIVGRSETELLGVTAQDLTHPEDLADERVLAEQLLAGEIRTYELEKRLFHADGTIIWTLVSVSLVRDDRGAPKHFIAQIQDISDRKRYVLELRHMAEHDALTGLANRRALKRELRRSLTTQGRSGTGLALLVVDLDHFKDINDTIGHTRGDRVIAAAADALALGMPERATVARLGGDEFAVLLPATDLEVAKLVADDIRATLTRLRPTGTEEDVDISATIGIVLAGREDAVDEETLLAAADLAMHEAKQSGRGRYAVYDVANGSQSRASDALNLSQRIRGALQNDLFVLHYQPIVSLTDPSDVSFEALIRMADEPDTLVEPGTFLPVAELYGLMPAIDRWVIQHVLTALSGGELPGGARIAVNLSAHSLTDGDLLELIAALLAEHGVAPERLIFEVTESAAIANMGEAKRFGETLHRLGCGFALDDFGTGFGSFIHLKYLPYDYIKIDGEFVRGMTSNPDDRLLVEALARLAQGMGKKTVAEFVGDEETIVMLRELGVDYAQGYHLGKPIPAADIARKRHRRPRTAAAARPAERKLVDRLAHKYGNTIRIGDPHAAATVIDDALRHGLTPVEIQAQLIAPAMYRTGELWASGALTVADEHLATAVSEHVLARLYPAMLRRPLRPGDTVVVAAVHGEHHVLGLRMAADVFEGAGFDVRFLGADVPALSLLAWVTEHHPVAVALGATMPLGARTLLRELQALRAHNPDLRLIVGGQGVPILLRENAGVFFARDTERLDDYAPGLVNAPRQGELPRELPAEEVFFDTPRTVPTSPAGDAEERLQKTAAAVASAARGQARRAFALEQIAFRDPLTELWNRRAFEDRFERLNTGLSPNPLSILMIDLDRLGAVNERSGHEAGDRALIGVAQCLADIMRPSDFAARYGGDEFVALLPDTSLTQAAEIGEQLRDRVERDLEWSQLTVSIGVCAADEAGRRRATLDVHQAVYEAKQRGRNQVALVAR